MKHAFAASLFGVAVYEIVGLYTDLWPTITSNVADHPVIGSAAWGAVVVGVTVHFIATIMQRRAR